MAQPSWTQIAQLPTPHRHTVDASHIDHNGHMNVVHHFTAQVAGVREALAAVGVTEDYVATRRLGTFAAEHHLSYLGELRLGDRYSVRTRFLGRRDKVAHLAAFLTNDTAEQLANVLEVISVHVDLGTRRATAFPADVGAQIDAAIESGDALGWTFEPRLGLRP
ncbi:thioesterase family protein [Aeromicrobium senzhongii]|uniref:Thioesterase family protein n=1 Tax=Aeromicrobium senzhongii TaxID=2663859 RepID=A0ABX6SST6_9ACTN|nr:thioesterase family protein [Aeromicrobium senzhongii]QNL93775.1 thioesterase family protein [Aeromicrobium senzhongii]